MELWRSLSGTVEIELTGADLSASLSAIQTRGIEVRQLERIDALQLTFQIDRREYSKLLRIADIRADKLKIIRKDGMFWPVAALGKRPVLLLGLFLLLLASWWLPRRIFFVQVEGNVAIPSRLIAEKAAECGIVFGSNRKEVRSERMKNALLEAIPQLSWAGINTNGCTAVITVREREEGIPPKEITGITSIVATQDGIIREMTVVKGNALCATGQAVKKGQVLISGYTDCGICIRATGASGEIFAETKRSQTAIIPSIFQNRANVTGKAKKYSFIIGKKRIFFTNSSGISDTTCAKIYEEKYMTLPGGFVLPVAVAVETWVFYDTVPQTHPFADRLLISYCRDYQLKQMNCGTILKISEQIKENDEILRLDADYSCYEMISITRTEEIEIHYGEND